MKQELISKIKRNAAMGRETVHGAYTYRVAWNEEASEFQIQRARTCDADRQWIGSEGNIHLRMEVDEVKYFNLAEAAQELAAHVTFTGILFAACTACASVEPETRQRGVFVHAMGDEFGYGDCVLFNGAELPANEEEARALLKESADYSSECLDSIEFVR